MLDTFRKICMTMAALVLTAAGYVHGDDFSSYEGDDSCCPTPVCAPQCGWCPKGFVSADFLYWRAYENGLDVCGPSESVDIVNRANGTVESFFKGKTHDPHFKWAPGFRIGAGYDFTFNCCDWEVAAFWTHFHSKAERHHGDEQKFHWKLDFDVIDVVLGREFDFGSYIPCLSCWTFTPYVGLRGARIDQKTRGFLENVQVFTVDTEHNKQKFTGVGTLVGLETNWNLGCGFGIYADTAISCLWGKFRVTFEDTHSFPFGAEFTKLRRHLQACQLVFDSGVGISWRKCFWNNKQFLVKIGFEQHRYFDYNRIGSYGDLCLTGGVVSAGVEF